MKRNIKEEIPTKRVTVFGDTIGLPPHQVPVAVKLSLERTGQSTGVCRWTGRYYLTATFAVGGEAAIETGKEFFLAQGAAAESMAHDINGGLFWKLERGGFTEQVRERLSGFLLDQFEAGHVTEKDLRDTLEKLLRKKD